jgi:cytochrome P450 / NADPH-cytochrome P450 reductase
MGSEGREIFVSSRDLANEIFDEKRFCKLVFGAVDKLRPAGGNGLITAQEGNHEWGVAHRILMPVFGPLRIRDMFDDMRDVAEQLCLKWYAQDLSSRCKYTDDEFRARHGPNHSVDVVDDMTRLTLDTLALCAMDYRFNSFYLNEERHPFNQALSRVAAEADKRTVLPEFLNVFRPRAVAQFKKDVQTMSDICREIVHKRRANPEPEGRDLLHSMLNGRDPKTGDSLTEENIIHNLNTFIIAGHDTTSGLLSFTLYYLLDNPETLLKARAEVDSVIDDDETLSVKHLQNLPYVDAVLKESIRLQPPVAGVHLRPLRDVEIIGGKYLLKKTDPIAVLLQKLHRDPAVWGADAEAFKPERMAPEKFDKLPQNSYKPFGNGPRACIGRAFAWQEAMMVRF